jgi:ABC-type lipoprotein export system ATPase subunit
MPSDAMPNDLMPNDRVAGAETVADCYGLVQVYRVDSGEVHALRGIDASFASGSVTAIMGPSGSGKSTLLRVLALVERPTAGSLTIAGVDAVSAPVRTLRRLRRRSIAVVLQRPTHNLFPQLTVTQHLELGSQRRGVGHSEVGRVLDAVALTARRDSRPRQLSGGEQQRLAIAMATIGDPILVLADEPTAELDTDSGTAVIALLRASAARGAAVVVNTHDAAVAASADRVLALHHGTLHSERYQGGGTVAVIDAIGRVQLPPELLAEFPDLRAEIRFEDGAVVLRPTGRKVDDAD